MKTFTSAALLAVAAFAQDEIVVAEIAWEPFSAQNVNTWDYYFNLAENGVSDQSAYPATEDDMILVLNASGLQFLTATTDETFDFGSEMGTWDKGSFDLFMAGFNNWLVDMDINITMMVVNDVCPALGYDPVVAPCDFNFANIGDYIAQANTLEAGFMALDWTETAAMDPFYVLTAEQINETVEVFASAGIEVSAEEITAWQDGSIQQAEAMGISSMDDLTQDKICEILVSMETVDLSEFGWSSCADVTPDNLFAIVDASMKEEGTDLSAMGIRSFEDINMDTAFNQFSMMMKESGLDMQEAYGVSSFDDLTSEKLQQMLADAGIELTEEQKEGINMNFSEVKSAAKQASMQLNEVVAMAVGEENTDSGAYSVLASAGAVAVAVAALAF